jgi:hypothetical protein
MTRGTSIVGLLVAAALCGCALGAAGASAYTLHECVTAGSGGTVTTRYTSATCETTNPSGTFETKPISTITAQSVKATGTSEFTLRTVIAGVPFKVVCTGLGSSGATAINAEEPAGSGTMLMKGTGKLLCTGASVAEPMSVGCTVPSTIETAELKWTTGASGSIKYEPSTLGGPIATFSVTGCTGPHSILNGTKELSGTLQSALETATTQAFTTSSGSTARIGGQAATFTGKYHFSTPGGQILGLETP